MDVLRKTFSDTIKDTVTTADTPILALLYQSFGELSEFFGSKVTMDSLIPLLIAASNRREFAINLACLKSIQKVGIKVGK